MYCQRIDSTEWFIEKDKRRIRNKSSSDLQPSFFTTAQSISLVLSQPRKIQFCEKLLKPFCSLIFGYWHEFQNGHDILFDGQLPKDGRLLSKVSHSVPGTLKHRHMRNIF